MKMAAARAACQRGIELPLAGRWPAGRGCCHAVVHGPLVSAESCESSISCLRELTCRGGALA